MLMRGLVRLSQAVIETQTISLRSGGVQAMNQSMQMTTEQAMSVAMQKIQVGPVTSFQPLQCTASFVYLGITLDNGVGLQLLTFSLLSTQNKYDNNKIMQMKFTWRLGYRLGRAQLFFQNIKAERVLPRYF